MAITRVKLENFTVFESLDLEPSPGIILRCVQEEDAGGPIRPLLAPSPGSEQDYDPEARIAELLAQRLPAYSQALYTVETDTLTPEGVEEHIGAICGIRVS